MDWCGRKKKKIYKFFSALHFCHPPDLWALKNYYDHHLNLVVVIHLFYEYLYAVAISKRSNKKCVNKFCGHNLAAWGVFHI